MSSWYVRTGDGVSGPFTLKQLQEQAVRGEITLETLIRSGRSTQLIRAGDLSELPFDVQEIPSKPVPKRVPPPPLLPTPKSRIETIHTDEMIQGRRGNRLPWIVAACVLAVGTLGLGVWLGQNNRPEPLPAQVAAVTPEPASVVLPEPESRRDPAPESRPEHSPAPKPVAKGIEPVTTQAEPTRHVVPERATEQESASEPEPSTLAIPDKESLAPKRIIPPPQKQKTPATKLLFAEFQKELKKERRATDAYQLYLSFAGSHSFDAEQQKKVDADLKAWRERSEAGLVALGNEWATLDAARTAAKDADRIVDQAFSLLELKSFPEAIDRFEEASRADPNGILADSILGLMHSFSVFKSNSPEKAEIHYRKVLQRFPDHLAGLNNIAVSQIKQGKFEVALGSLSRLAEIAPRCREATQNIGRVISLNDAKRIRLSAGAAKRYSTLYLKLIGSGKGQPANNRVGWLYMATYVPDAERRTEAKGKQELVAWGRGTGFVVAPGYVLTNRHVVYDDEYELGVVDAVRTIDPTDKDRKREVVGKVVAISDETDLALVQFPGLTAKPLGMSDATPRLAQPVMILGYPRSDIVGLNLKAVTGIVSGVPEGADERLLLDAVSNQGNSGGPVLDKTGRVVAVYTWVLTVGAAVRTTYGAGIIASRVQPFLEKHIPDYFPPDFDGIGSEWDAVAATAGPSVLALESCFAAGSPKLLANEKGDALEDRSCISCVGSGIGPCPQRGCNAGSVLVKYTENSTQLVDDLGKTITYSRQRTRKETCPICNGKGHLDCSDCYSGLDRDLMGGAGR